MARPEVHSDEFQLGYIRLRKEKGISNVTINMEVGILRRVLKRAKRWAAVSDEIPRLPERRDVGRALTHAEKARLAKTAASKPEWQVARLAMTLALNTTTRGCELKGLCWRDVNLLERSLTVRRSKTEAGERIIPLNADAFAAALECRERISRLSMELSRNRTGTYSLRAKGKGQGRAQTRPP